MIIRLPLVLWFKDSEDNGLYPTERNQIEADQIQDSYDDLIKPYTAKLLTYMSSDKWEGFTIDDNTELVVLDTVSTGADGKTNVRVMSKREVIMMNFKIQKQSHLQKTHGKQ